MISNILCNFRVEKELLFDIAKKIELEEQSLSVKEIQKLLQFSCETFEIIFKKTNNPNEKQYCLDEIGLLNEICKDYDSILLKKYTRHILMSLQRVF